MYCVSKLIADRAFKCC